VSKRGHTLLLREMALVKAGYNPPLTTYQRRKRETEELLAIAGEVCREEPYPADDNGCQHWGRCADPFCECHCDGCNP
jgi:hypothetical protein